MITEPETRILLDKWQGGGMAARDALITKLHPQLSLIASARLRGERDTSLSTGDLVNETILRLIQVEKLQLKDRAHLLALASHMMRHVLIDRARQKQTDKRRHQKVELTTNVEAEQSFDLHFLDSALKRLARIDVALMEIVEMRYFGGMTIAEIAQVQGVSEATIKRRWQTARAWLSDALSHPSQND
jgi:RNA polymerase sigma factor (TIGR02999 family)